MIELILVSGNLEDERKIRDSLIVDRFYYNFLDSNSAYTKKQAYGLKKEWGAREEPFVLVQKEDKVLRAFYSESSTNVIDDALEFIKGLKETYD